MSILQQLIDSASADVDVLRSLDANRDNFSQFRDVDFLFRAASGEIAKNLATFINDCHYGLATLEEQDGNYTVSVIVSMPIQQHIILSVSGFMTCLAALHGAEFDGWGCVAQTGRA